MSAAAVELVNTMAEVERIVKMPEAEAIDLARMARCRCVFVPVVDGWIDEDPPTWEWPTCRWQWGSR